MGISPYLHAIHAIVAFLEKHVIEKAEKGKSYWTFEAWITGRHSSTADAFVGDLLVDAYLATGNTHYYGVLALNLKLRRDGYRLSPYSAEDDDK